MEFFIPGILIFLVAIGITFTLVPKATPFVAAILSIVFLTFGVYEHYKMFSAEYRLSTWQNSLKIYAPAIMIAAIILFILYAIFAFFTKGSVPVPTIPNISIPSPNTITANLIDKINNGTNIVNNKKNDLITSINNTIDKINNRSNNNVKNNNTNKNNENNLSRSFLETL
jgi:hypothetical protein